jgi:hypothetical protein
VTTTEEARLSRMLKQAVPEPPRELSAARITAQPVGHQPGRRSGRLWLMPAIAVTAAAAAATAAVIVLPASGAHPGAGQAAGSAVKPAVKAKPTVKPTVKAKAGSGIPSAVPTSAAPVTYSLSGATADLTAAYVLDKAATALGSHSGQQSGWPAGAYWHTLQQVIRGGSVYTDNIWIDRDGDGVGDGSTTGPPPPGGDAPYQISSAGSIFSIGQQSYTQAQLDALPTDPAKLWPIVKADEQLAFSSDPALPKSGSSDLFQSIWNLLTSDPVPPALRKALYQVTAEIPGVTVDGTYTDSLGRTGTVLHVGMWRMVVDTSNGQVLAMIDAPGPGATVCGSSGCFQQPGPGAVTSVYISAGWVTAAGVPKVAAGSGGSSGGGSGSGAGSAPRAGATASAASRP